MSIHDVLTSWDRQQEAYVPAREQRFTVMADVLAAAVGRLTRVIDLGCGPGSLSLRLLERFPDVRILALDVDPVMVELAGQALSGYGDRVQVVRGDLADGSWISAVGGSAPEAVVSTTALHWLTPAELIGLYQQVAALLPEGGVFLNGDHMEYGPAHPTLAAVAAQHGRSVEEAAFRTGVPSWERWWEMVAATPELVPAKAVRDARFADDSQVRAMGVGFHLAALGQAGFTEVSTVWQFLDDYVVFGRR
jgi:trans-aconitate methyltransferase